MFSFLKKKKNDLFVTHLTEQKRNEIVSIFFKHMAELYATTDSPGLKIEVGNFETIPMKFYFEASNELLKKMDVNIAIEKHGMDADKPEDRYFLLKVIK